MIMLKPLEDLKEIAEPSWVEIAATVALEEKEAEMVETAEVALVEPGLPEEETEEDEPLAAVEIVALVEETGLIHLVSVHVTVSKLVVKMVEVMAFPEASV